MAPLVGIGTCREVAGLDPDDRPLVGLLAARGIGVRPVVWSDAGQDTSALDLVVLRSTWDYHARREEFLAWAEGLPRVLNAPDVLRWNTDKAYLRELTAAGLPVVPTVWAPPGAPVALPDGEVVVKPSVSAGSKDTARYRPEQAAAARAHVRALQSSGRTAMIQPYLAAVDADGETAVIFLEGVLSHAVRKGPILRPGAQLVDGLYAEETIDAREASPAEVAIAEAVLDALPFPRAELLYARVDLVPGSDGTPVVLEVELAEPSLFLGHAPGAAERLAAAIARRL
jgi:glutathione synthase/RimK-type ligase-like ATP-grasp enzyme